MGDDAAEDLVTWMQGVDAQRAELRALNELNFSRLDPRLAALQTGVAHLRQATQELRQTTQTTQTELAELRQEMRIGFVTLGGDLRQDMARLEARFERRIADLIKWSFVFWVGAVGGVAMLAGVLG